MNRRSFLKHAVLMSIIVLSGCSMDSALRDQKSSPNILLILIDDMGWKDMGCSGSQYYQTPHIDALAGAGLRFENAYSSSPVCSPSRGAIFSGKNPARTKFTTVFTGKAAVDDRLYDKSKDRGDANQYLEALHRHNLPITETLFSEALRDAGYATAFFGKWHCGVAEGYTPDKRGFQVAKGHRKVHVPTGKSGHWGRTFRKYGANMDDIADDDYLSEVLTDKCIDFMKENKDTPFLAVLSHYLVHNPIQPKSDKLARYKNRPTTDQDNPGYAAMIESVDDSVGRLVAALDELEIADNTLVVFTSDNGGLTPNVTSNYPLLGGKSFSFEAGMKVPLLVRWPSVVKPGQVTDERTISMDLYPTFLEAAGVGLLPEQHADGISLLPLLKHNTVLEKRPIVFHFPHYTGSTGLYSSIIDNDWKLIHYYNDQEGAYLLFNLKADPVERKDLSEAHPEKVEQLAARLDEQLKEMKAEMPIKNPDYDPAADKKHMTRKQTRNLAEKHRALFEKRLSKPQ